MVVGQVEWLGLLGLVRGYGLKGRERDREKERQFWREEITKKNEEKKKVRASPSTHVKSSKIKKGASFTYFRQKNTHISGCKDV